MTNPENQAKIKEEVAKLLPEGTNMEELKAKLDTAFAATEGRKKKVMAVLVDAGFDFKTLKKKVSYRVIEYVG